MTNIENLMFRREHFPVIVKERTTFDGRKYYDFRIIQFPLCHHSIVENGINLDLAISVLDETLEETLKDLEGVADKINIQSFLEGIRRDPKTGKIKYKAERRDSSHIKFSYPNFPIVEALDIKREIVCFPGSSASCGPDYNKYSHSFQIPKSVVFSPELIREYKMREIDSEVLKIRYLECFYYWRSHNTSAIKDIFMKNFAIALDNEVVRRKYSNK